MNMEVDERLRWLESRISSSLRPRGDELRNLFSDEENRVAFLAFCNHSESRRLFVYQIPELMGDGTEGIGQIRVSATPPKHLSDKALFFLKCNHASKLSRESMGSDVVYTECPNVPLNHLELVMREVYLPLMSSCDTQQQGVSADKLLDLLHRLIGTMQVTNGLSDGRVVLPLPSIEVLAEAATSSSRRGTVIHIMESSVISWMKQVKIALHLDPASSIVKKHGQYAGPLSEYEFWSNRLASLESVRGQLNSIVVLNILRSLDQAHSTYSQAFIHIHRDIGRAIGDTEHCLVYLNTLQPWVLKLNQTLSPEAQIRLFPSLLTTLLLIWQHSGIYSASVHFDRLLRLLSNDIMQKAKDIIGGDLLEDPEQSLADIKLALRVCAAFRGCYLDFREKAEIIAQRCKEERTSRTVADENNISKEQSKKLANMMMIQEGSRLLCFWPPRNSPVFSPLNAIMERCNDLLELLQTLLDFRELELIPFGSEQVTNCRGDPIIVDVHSGFQSCMKTFQSRADDLLDLEPECSFEEHFFHFRSKVKDLEQRLVPALKRAFDTASSLPAQLRVLEMYQGISKRDAIKASLQPQLASIISNLISEMSSVRSSLDANFTTPPSFPLIPPMACKLLWLHALKARTSEPMEVIKKVAPKLLEGDEGWKLRQAHTDLLSQVESHVSHTESSWIQGVPMGLYKKLRENILTRTPEGHLVVNLDPTLSEVLSEVRYLTHPPLNIRLPTSLRQLVKSIDSSELKHRQTSLQVIVQTYNKLQDGLSDIDRMLLQHKLQQIEKLLQVGLDQLDWVSTAFPDFIAKASAAVCGDLQGTLDQVHGHIQSTCTITKGWSKLEGLDMFQSEREGPQDLTELEEAHDHLLDALKSTLPASMERISQYISTTFQCIHEASQESPAWLAYLKQIDGLVISGLKDMMLRAISTLVSRVVKYEQGATIPPLVMVELELQGSDVQFSPPLSSYSAFSSVPEVVQKWMSNYSELAKLCPKFGSGVEKTCYEVMKSDPDIKNSMSKICAHLETNSRQCQSLRKRFTIYSFLWEQDVGVTFGDFLRGRAAPHPRRFTRPETVRGRSSARAHSASRPKSSTPSLSSVMIPPEPNLPGVISVTDWDFLQPPSSKATTSSSSSPEDDHTHRPSLEDFDGEIAVFQGILDRLKNIENVNNVGWVCVDQRPVKQALSSLASKWKHVYANHLEKQVGLVLSNLEKFFQEIEPEVDAITGDESDTQAFMKLMSIFNQVNAQQNEMDTKFGAAHRAVVILDKFEHPLPFDLRKQFSNAPSRWSNLKKRVALGKQRIGPRIQAKGGVISQDLHQFGVIFTTLNGHFRSSRCLRHDCPRHEALGMLAEFGKELKALQVQARDLIELQELLETSVFNFSLLKKLEVEISTLHELWNIYESIVSQHALWYKHRWNEVETSELLVETEKQTELLSGLPAKVVQDWDVYLNLNETVNTVQISVPMVEGLKSPAMRPRHWKQVIRYASRSSHLLGRGGTFDPSLLEELTFGQLLQMNLHVHLDDVLSLVERASKDVAIESLLNTFEEVWLSRQLELKIHKRVSDSAQQEVISDLGIDGLNRQSATPKSRAPSARVTSGVRRSQSIAYPSISATHGSTSVPPHVALLCNTGSIFETLESHQTSLQSLEGTMAAVSFADELHKWHKQLQTIEAVLIIWLKVQHLWVQLEEVYSFSDIQQHLSSQAFIFSNADREFRELMSLTAKNPAVLAICLKDELLFSLDKMHNNLQQCQVALVQYMEGQRFKCSWFYLLPLEDILQLVCYGSSLHLLSKNLPKILHHVGGLHFNGTLPSPSLGYTPIQGGGEKGVAYRGEGGGVSIITAVLGKSGEIMDLNQGVSCEGPVESIISKLLSSISSTLKSHLSTTQTRLTLEASSSPPQSSLPSLSNLHDLWISNTPTQIALMVVTLFLESSLSLAVQNTSSNQNVWPLNDLSKEVHDSLIFISQLLQGKFPRESEHEVKGSSNLTDFQSEGGNAGSDVALKSSVPGSQFEESEYNSSLTLTEEQRPSQTRNTKSYHISPDQVTRFQKIAVILYSYKRKINELRQLLELMPNVDLMKSSNWESMLHFDWLPEKQTCLVSALDASFPNGCNYSETARPFLHVPQSENALHYMLQAMSNGTNILLVGAQSVGKTSLVHELSSFTGQLLFSFHCSSQVSHITILNCIRGMAATGCLLYLHSIDKLEPDILQTTCSLLSLVQQARLHGKSSLRWMGENIKISSEGVCLASISTPLPLLSDYVLPPILPSSLVDAFKICSVEAPDRREILNALFGIHLFENAASLAESLQTFCSAFEEIFTPLSTGCISGPNSSTTSVASVYISLHWLKTVVLLSQKHMREFYNLGAISADNVGQPVAGDGLHAPSMVYSEISESTRASMKGRISGTEDASQLKVLQRQSLEEFSLVLALKDSMLCSFLPGSQDYQIIVKLIRDLFPNCDIEGLLAHEGSVREGMAVKARQNPEAGESARESRAASVMQMMQDDRHSSEATSTVEEQIVQGCYLLHFIPTPTFQSAVAQIVSLVQMNRFVAVCGPSNCGKTAAIQVAAEALRQSSSLSQVCCITTTTIAVNAMREEQLLGHQNKDNGSWQDGVLSHLLSSAMSSSGGSSGEGSSVGGKVGVQWFILDGTPTPDQMDTLASCYHESTLTLSNGHSIFLSPSIKFILEVPDVSVLTPALAAKVARVVIPPDTISWKDIVSKWLYNFPDHRSLLEALFNKYVPQTLDFISPALLCSDDAAASVEQSTLSVSASPSTIEAQELKLSEVHIINTCCNILQSILPFYSTEDPYFPEDMERVFIYAMVWSCGGFLSVKNKITFDHWWRTSMNSDSNKFLFPESGTLWDYYTKPDSHAFLSWRSSLPSLSLPPDKTTPCFVPSVRSSAVIHLISLLIGGGFPVLLNGIGGSGKTSLLKYFLSDSCKLGESDTNLLHVYCNLLTSAEVIWNQISDCLEWDWGKKYTPKENKKLFCCIDDLHNVECSGPCELVRQHLSTGRVCDAAMGKWHDISKVCYLVTTDQSSQISPLTSQVLKHFAVIQWDSYSSEELVHILDSLLKAYIFPHSMEPSSSSTTPTHDHRCITPDIGHKLVQAAVQIHSKLTSIFLSTPERLHYCFTLKDLTAVFRHLCVKFSDARNVHVQDLLLEWQRQTWWKWAGQMSSQVDRDRYWETVSHALRKYFNQDSMLPLLLLESSTELPPEVIQDVRARLKNELLEYNLSYPAIHINLYDCTVEEVCYLSHTINSPPDLGHVITLGNAHPEPLVRLASLHCGYTVVKVSQFFSQNLLHSSSQCGMSPSSYDIPQFRKDLIAICTTAGVKNEKLVLLLTEKEILHESFLTSVYEFVKDCAISALFTKEERAKIISGVRGDLTQLGVVFSKDNAWNFFLKRVKANLRVVVSLPELRDVVKSGCYRWQELFRSISVHTQLPWERKRLVEVATFHLQECEYLAAGQVEGLAHLLASIHLQLRTRREIRASNATYQHFVERFVHELNMLHKTNQSESSQLTFALSCLQLATEKVSCLIERVRREEVVLAEKSEACIKLLVQIGQDTAISCQHNKLVTKQRERIAHLKKVIPDFEHAYSLAVQNKENLVTQSRQLVEGMDQSSLSELRSLQRPPPDIEELLVAVITIIKGTSADFSWTKGAKRLMANLDRFRELLLEFSAHEENSEVLLEALDPVIMKPSFSAESFSEHPTVGLAASQLCMWVQGVVRLHNSLQTKIRPLHLKVTNMKASLSEYSDKLKKEENKVAVLGSRLKGLSAALESASVEKSKQQELLTKMKKDLKETQDFIASLTGFQEHWQSKLNSCLATISRSVGSLCLSVTLTCYLASLEPQAQMEVINVKLVPILEERGIELSWENCNKFMRAISDVSTAHRGNDTESVVARKDSVGVEPEDTESKDLDEARDIKNSVSHLSSSYASLSSCMLSRMVPEDVSDHWLSLSTAHLSLSFLLCSGLVHTSWNKWPLIFDPQNLASEWIQKYDEEVVCLDATDRSAGFYLSLEHALVHGESILVTHFPCPMDPALQPVIELGHTWNTTKDQASRRVIIFCGHRLHVHPKFHLYLTTTVSPMSLPRSFITDLNVINLSFSVPLSQDVLLDAAFHVLLEEDGSEFRTLCEEVVALKAKLRELEKYLFESLPGEGKEESYWNCTDKILSIVTSKNEVSEELESHMESLNHFCQTLSLLVPVARHGAMVYNIMGQTAKTVPFSLQGWKHFMNLFREALVSYVKRNPDTSGRLRGGNDSVQREIVNGILQQMNQTLLQNAFRYTDHQTWCMLAFSVVLLSESDLPYHSTLPLAEQLLYLSRGLQALSGLELIQESPPPSLFQLQPDFWDALQKIPLSVDYYGSVLKTLEENPHFWEKVLNQSETNLMKFSDFPWKNRSCESGLDDHVMLKFLDEESYSNEVSLLTESLTKSITVPLLSDVLDHDPSLTPLLLFYDESCPRSQAMLCGLEDEIQRILGDKTVLSLRLGAGFEEAASQLLSESKTSVLLLMDVQFTSQQWKNMLLWRIQQAMKEDCSVICTASVRSTLPGDLVGACRTAHLSRLATHATKHLPVEVWMADRYTDQSSSFRDLLQFNFAHIPESIFSQCDSLTSDLHLVVFDLIIIHTAVAIQPLRGNELAPIRYTYLLTCLSKLVSMSENKLNISTILLSLRKLVAGLYSCCVAKENLEALISECLSERACSPDSHIKPHPNVEVTVPATNVPLKKFVEQVGSLVVTEIDNHLFKHRDFIGAIESFLLPLLTQVPSPELYSLPSTSQPFSPYPSPNHHQYTSSQSRAVAETLEHCSERLPQPLSLAEEISESAKWELVRQLRVGSQLKCASDYHLHLYYKSVAHFNSVLVKIQRDIEIFTKFAAIGFDGLPQSLQPVLACLEAGTMPKGWRAQSKAQQLPTPLNQGLQELADWHAILLTQT